MDNRAQIETEEMLQTFPEDDVYRRTGRKMSPELLAPKLLWLRKHEQFDKVATIIGLKDEIVRRLTDTVQTDYAHANYTVLYNVHRGAFDHDIASALGISLDVFPAIHSATEVVGALSRNCARQLGIQDGIPVVCGSSDGTTAMYGGGILNKNRAVLVSGTSDVLMMLSPEGVDDQSGILSLNTGMVKDTYVIGGVMGLSGGALNRFGKLFQWPLDKIVEQVKDVQPGSGGLLCIPGLSGERAPYWKENLTGSLLGLTLDHQPEHIIRALFEGTAYRIKQLILILQTNNLCPQSINMVGGCSEIDSWNQIRADVTGLEVVRLRETEATSLGTALFCRTGIGECATLQEATADWIQIERSYQPDPKNHEIYLKLAEIFEAYITRTEGIYEHLKDYR
jgi:sugar (pentulose or hexulose) kinase